MIPVGVLASQIAAGGGMRLWVPTDAAMQPSKWMDPKDASTLTMSSGLISQLRSKVGTITADATGSLRPTYNSTARNGLPGVVLNGSTYMTLSSVLPLPRGNTASTIAVVGYGADSSRMNQGFFAYGDASQRMSRIMGYNNNGANGIWVSNFAEAEFSVGNWFNVDHVVIAEQPAGSNPTFTLSVDGTVTSMTTSGTPNTGNTAGFIGRFAMDIGDALIGTLQEVVVYPGNLTSDDRPKLQGYLAWNNNQQANLPADHPYKSAPPMVPA